MIASLLKNYPMLDYVWFFQEENQGQAGWKVEKGSAQEKLVAANCEPFKYLGAPERVAEGVRLNHVCQLVYRIVKKYRQDLPIIISGWGGDSWMHCTDYYLGLDKTLAQGRDFRLPGQSFPQSEPNVSKVYGQLPVERIRWPIPWWNNDCYSLWDPQCTTRYFVPICRDVYQKKCQGMLAIHWLTREVEEVAAYQAQFAWNPAITYEGFYDGFAQRCYGETVGGAHEQNPSRLESLGPRWTGASAETDIRPVQWSIKNHTEKKENRQKLAQIRADLETIHKEMVAQTRLEGIERIEWLLTTIDWLTRYDDACLKSVARWAIWNAVERRRGGQSERRRGRGQAEGDGRAGDDAQERIPRGHSDVSEENELHERVRRIRIHPNQVLCLLSGLVGSSEEDSRPGCRRSVAVRRCRRALRRFLVGKNPNSVIEPSQDLVVNVVAISGSPIASCTLNYRTVGDANWKQLPMTASYRRTYTASIPSAELKGFALEWYVEAMDQSKGVAHWPKGYPNVVWSASISVPFKNPLSR